MVCLGFFFGDLCTCPLGTSLRPPNKRPTKDSVFHYQPELDLNCQSKWGKLCKLLPFLWAPRPPNIIIARKGQILPKDIYTQLLLISNRVAWWYIIKKKLTVGMIIDELKSFWTNFQEPCLLVLLVGNNFQMWMPRIRHLSLSLSIWMKAAWVLEVLFSQAWKFWP